MEGARVLILRERRERGRKRGREEMHTPGVEGPRLQGDHGDSQRENQGRRNRIGGDKVRETRERRQAECCSRRRWREENED
jgi:hypothetical protein